MSALLVNPPSPVPPGLKEFIEAQGHSAVTEPDGWLCDDLAVVQAIIAAYSGSAAELQHAQEQAASALVTFYEGVINAGFKYAVSDGADPTTHVYQIDEIPPYNAIGVPERRASQDTMTTMTAWADQAVRGVNAWPANFAWRDASNAMVPMTAVQCLAFTQAAGAYVAACFGTYCFLYAEIMGATSYAAVQAIDITSGWPANSG